ncbi:2-succinylbenzoate--CoA ligase, partial [Leptolyngbya sp. FACHB-36]|uniref:2-succinylbenzoate--CoA ligase n=1 Tax=Leptolyngbya sp. FACHB-36 TaxID=2692808 RepID=UPI001680924F
MERGAREYWRQRANDDWLIGHDNRSFFQSVDQTLQALEERSSPDAPLTVLIADVDPVQFLAHFVAACAANCRVVLANPQWGAAERQQVFQLVQPDVIWGTGDWALGTGEPHQRISVSMERYATEKRVLHAARTKFNIQPATGSLPLILIPTGGSSGSIRFAMHTWDTLMASVQGFRQYFGVDRVCSFCVLPLYHVSGLMQFLRSFTSGGRLIVQPFKAIESGSYPDVDFSQFFFSLVPTQLHRLLQSPNASRLTSFRTVLLGGAPAWAELLEQARSRRIPLAPTYGMTETASQVVTLKPEAFLSGGTGCGQVLPHAAVTIRSPLGEVLAANQTGIVTIAAESLALGYYPTRFESDHFQTDDLGFFDDQGNLHLVGRRSDKIITGGENVFPAEVEAAIRSTELVADVCVVGVDDRHWGQVVSAIYVPRQASLPADLLHTALDGKLSRFKRPKRWIAVDRLPRNAQGKLNRDAVRAIVSDQMPTTADATESEHRVAESGGASLDQYTRCESGRDSRGDRR